MSDPILKRMFNLMYPVGSVYLSTNSTSPAVLFGGSWTQITGRFLYCTTTSKTTGGNSTHTHTQGSTGSTAITVAQMPSHTHKLRMRNNGKWDWNSGSAAGDKMEGGYYWDAGNVTYNWLIDNEFIGGNQGHTHTNPTTASASSLPPYFTVYCWYRTA